MASEPAGSAVAAAGPLPSGRAGPRPRLDRSGYASLVLQFALKDFKIRYTHSVLGYAWSVLNPLMFFLIYYLVFTHFMRFDLSHYPEFLLVGVALWNFFSGGTS